MSKALLKYGAFTHFIDIVEPRPEIEIIEPRGLVGVGTQSNPATLEDLSIEKTRLRFRYREEVVLYDNTVVYVYDFMEEL